MKRNTTLYCSQQIFHAARIWSTRFPSSGLRPPELFFTERHAALQQDLHQKISQLGSVTHDIDQKKAAQLIVLRDRLERQLLSAFVQAKGEPVFNIDYFFRELLSIFDAILEEERTTRTIVRGYSESKILINSDVLALRAECCQAYEDYLRSRFKYLTLKTKNSVPTVNDGKSETKKEEPETTVAGETQDDRKSESKVRVPEVTIPNDWQLDLYLKSFSLQPSPSKSSSVSRSDEKKEKAGESKEKALEAETKQEVVAPDSELKDVPLPQQIQSVILQQARDAESLEKAFNRFLNPWLHQIDHQLENLKTNTTEDKGKPVVTTLKEKIQQISQNDDLNDLAKVDQIRAAIRDAIANPALILQPGGWRREAVYQDCRLKIGEIGGEFSQAIERERKNKTFEELNNAKSCRAYVKEEESSFSQQHRRFIHEVAMTSCREAEPIFHARQQHLAKVKNRDTNRESPTPQYQRPEDFCIQLHADIDEMITAQIELLDEQHPDRGLLIDLRNRLEQLLLETFAKPAWPEGGFNITEYMPKFDEILLDAKFNDVSNIEKLRTQRESEFSEFKTNHKTYRNHVKQTYATYGKPELSNPEKAEKIRRKIDTSQRVVVIEGLEEGVDFAEEKENVIEDEKEYQRVTDVISKDNLDFVLNLNLKEMLRETKQKIEALRVKVLETDDEGGEIKGSDKESKALQKLKQQILLLTASKAEPPDIKQKIERNISQFKKINSALFSAIEATEPGWFKDSSSLHLGLEKIHDSVSQSYGNYKKLEQEFSRLTQDYHDNSFYHTQRKLIHDVAGRAVQPAVSTFAPSDSSAKEKEGTYVEELKFKSPSILPATTSPTALSTAPLSTHQLSYRLLQPNKPEEKELPKEVESKTALELGITDEKEKPFKKPIEKLQDRLNQYLAIFKEQWFHNSDKTKIVKKLQDDLAQIESGQLSDPESIFCHLMEAIDDADRANSRLSGDKLSTALNDMRQTLYKAVSPDIDKQLMHTLQNTAHTKAIAEHNKVHAVIVSEAWYDNNKRRVGFYYADPNLNAVRSIPLVGQVIVSGPLVIGAAATVPITIPFGLLMMWCGCHGVFCTGVDVKDDAKNVSSSSRPISVNSNIARPSRFTTAWNAMSSPLPKNLGNLVRGIPAAELTYVSQMNDANGGGILLFIPSNRNGDSIRREGFQEIKPSSWWKSWERAFAVFRTAKSACDFLDKRGKQEHESQTPDGGYYKVAGDAKEKDTIRFFQSALPSVGSPSADTTADDDNEWVLVSPPGKQG